MAFRILLSACALVLGAGCATVSQDQVSDTGGSSVGNGRCAANSATASASTIAVIDVGSSGPEMRIACVFPNADATEKMQRFIWLGKADGSGPVSENRDINFGEEVAANARTITEQFILDNIAGFSSLCSEAKSYDPSEAHVVATEAFRRATNGETAFGKFAEACEAELGLPGADFNAFVASHRGEGSLEYIGVSHTENIPLTGYHIVWGAGSNSMQITAFDRSADNGGRFEVVEGRYAGESFLRHVLANVKPDEPRFQTTPNPMTATEYMKSWKHAKLTAKSELTQNEIVRSRGRNDAYTIYGGGGTLTNMIDRMSAVPTFSRSSVNETAKQYLGRTDAEMPPPAPYNRLYVTNLALVFGYLSEFAPDKVVEKTDGGLIDGLAATADWTLIEPEY